MLAIPASIEKMGPVFPKRASESWCEMSQRQLPASSTFLVPMCDMLVYCVQSPARAEENMCCEKVKCCHFADGTHLSHSNS